MRENSSGGASVEEGRTEPGDRVATFQRTQGIEWAECDDVILQEDSGSLRPAWPREYARQVGVDRGDAVTPIVQTATGAVVFTPPGVDLADVLAAIDDR